MSRSTANYQTVISCDSPVCPTPGGERFITYSIARMARHQARAVGWQRLSAWTITTEDSPRRIYDICPIEAPSALERKAKRPEILLAERAAWKIARAEALIEKRDRRARRKAEKIAERERRTADRMRRKAEKTDELERREPVSVASPHVLSESRVPFVTRGGSPILAVIERVLAARGQPMTVAEIVGHAMGDLALPTASKTPRTIVSRDLALDIKKHGESSRFIRVAPGTFGLRPSGARQ